MKTPIKMKFVPKTFHECKTNGKSMRGMEFWECIKEIDKHYGTDFESIVNRIRQCDTEYGTFTELVIDTCNYKKGSQFIDLAEYILTQNDMELFYETLNAALVL